MILEIERKQLAAMFGEGFADAAEAEPNGKFKVSVVHLQRDANGGLKGVDYMRKKGKKNDT